MCGEWDIGPISERLSVESEVVLQVISYTNHPQFDIQKGVIEGSDISVYFVDDGPLKKEGIVKKGQLYPACLPSKAHKNRRGIFAGWSDPLDIGIFYTEHNPGGDGSRQENIDEYREKQLILKHVELEAGKCRDPEWMSSKTYYPKGIKRVYDRIYEKTSKVQFVGLILQGDLALIQVILEVGF